MGEKTEPNQEVHLPDIPHLIRSIQRIEGGSACFGMLKADCTPSSCRWHALCTRMRERKAPGPPKEGA